MPARGVSDPGGQGRFVLKRPGRPVLQDEVGHPHHHDPAEGVLDQRGPMVTEVVDPPSADDRRGIRTMREQRYPC